MGDFSRDSFRETDNVLVELRGLATAPPADPRHYVSVRLQQGVPLLDADWNEAEDIRRMELETLLVRAIGNGVPAGSDGFAIDAVSEPNDFLIGAGLLFLDGWLVYNRTAVAYTAQPHQAAPGVAPALPIPLVPAAAARTDLVYLDAWEVQVESADDGRLVEPRIGIETSVRLERRWVVRAEPIPAGADPLDPATIPNPQPGHRYYPLATLARQPGGQIGVGMITDRRRTHLTLEALTHAPLLVDDPVRGQQLNSVRLAGAFRGHLDALRDLTQRAPDTFVYVGDEIETWQAMEAYHDVRAMAVAFEQQAANELLHLQSAFDAMEAFYDVQRTLQGRLQQFIDDSVAGAAAADLVGIYATHLDGPPVPDSLRAALDADDVLGAVLAQERLNEAIALESDTLPEGTVTVSLISVTPGGAVAASVTYELTLRIQSQLTSSQGEEPILISASAGSGWSLGFVGATGPDPREHVVTVPNQGSADVVLRVTAAPGAAATTLTATVRPQRRQQIVSALQPAPALAIGDSILPEDVIVTLDYQGPPLQPGNVALVPRPVMAGGVTLPFGVTNLSADTEDYEVTVQPQGDDTGWVAPNEPVLPPLASGDDRVVNLTFEIDDEAGATSPLTYRIELVRVTGGANDVLAYARIDLTFDLQ